MQIRKYIVLGTVTTAMLVSGCADMTETQRRTATGAGIGAAAGAVLSSITGGRAETGAILGAGAGALGTYLWSQNMERQKREMEQATRGTGVAVTQTADNQLRLDIPSDISFDTGRSEIKPNFEPVLDRLAESMRNNPGAEVRIVGHTDNTGSESLNERLSLDRAISARNYLTARGVSGARIRVEGRGDREPIASNDSAQGRARNRRVEIYVGERQG